MHNKSIKDSSEPHLAPPGAGIPWLERLGARALIALRGCRYTPAWADRVIRDECAAVLALAAAHPEVAGVRVLIPRLRGLEDSSRYWSVFMTLDHLRIVNLGVAEIITQLGRGEVPGRAVRTAEVKPSPEVDQAVVPAFAASCAAVIAAASSIDDPRATPRHAHPWFGPFSAAQWHTMAGFHLRLHRAQVKAILHAAARLAPIP